MKGKGSIHMEIYQSQGMSKDFVRKETPADCNVPSSGLFSETQSVDSVTHVLCSQIFGYPLHPVTYLSPCRVALVIQIEKRVPGSFWRMRMKGDQA